MDIKCRLCGKLIESPQVEADYVYGGKPGQMFYHCPYCDVAFLYPPLTEEEEHYFYAKEFEKFMEKRAGKDYDWKSADEHVKSNEETFLRRLPIFSAHIAPEKNVLELGCSSGFMLYPLKEKKMNVVGIEPSNNFSEYVRSKGIEVYPSLESMFTNENSIKEFDLILHFFLLEHVPNPIEFLKELYFLLKPNGAMIFEIPNRMDPLISIYNIPAFHKFYWSVAHNWYFNQRSIEFVLKQVTDNFEIIPEQRYDLSNHITWALTGKPGGMKKYSNYFTLDLEKAYKESMKNTGYCDTLFVKVYKE